MPALHELVAGDAQQGITAVLGPTNTGKTHLAIERMLRHRSGMIGLPLRLLAREVYDKVVARVGAANVALVTGEEKVLPSRARYFVCTVEAMPERPVAFLAVDEIQLASHRTRGHVFTDRLLRARGMVETLFLGSSTMRPLVSELVPTAEILGQPRLSRLSHAGHRRLKRIGDRSAVVAFSAQQVYEVAERLRRQHGGAAVVLGALSPRTRNAQVDLYQSGEVPVLVATDAIGMGLNMDVDHVAFAATRKFDGRSHRELYDDELAQIAGRAGRFLRDGTFGTTFEAEPLDELTVEAIENHRFTTVKRLWWRSAELDYASPGALIDSLERPPRHRALKRMTDADDHRTLQAMLRIDAVADRASSADAVERLWEVAAVPDYRNSVTAHYAEMLGEIYVHLIERGTLPPEWVDERLDRLDRVEGDIGALMSRIAHVRTWTYVSHKSAWNDDPAGLQARARHIEDRLSDALHTRLTARFIDHRIVNLPPGQAPAAVILGADGDLIVDGQPCGTLVGLELKTELPAGRLREHVQEKAAEILRSRALSLVGCNDGQLQVDDAGVLHWDGVAVGRWARGGDLPEPAVELRGLPLLTPAHRAAVRLRLERWTARVVAALVARLDGATDPEIAVVVDDLRRGLGVAGPVPIRGLSDGARRTLARMGVRLGRQHTWLKSVFARQHREVRAALWRVWTGGTADIPGEDAATWVPDTRRAVKVLGYIDCGPVCLRVDRLEEVAATVRKAARRGPFGLPGQLLTLLPGPADQAAAVVSGLGYDRVKVAGEWRFVPRRR